MLQIEEVTKEKGVRLIEEADPDSLGQCVCCGSWNLGRFMISKNLLNPDSWDPQECIAYICSKCEKLLESGEGVLNVI